MAVCVCIVSGKSHLILLSPSARAMNTISWSWTCWSTQLCLEIDGMISLAARFPLSRGDSLRDPNADPPKTHPVVVRHPILWKHRTIFSHPFGIFPEWTRRLHYSRAVVAPHFWIFFIALDLDWLVAWLRFNHIFCSSFHFAGQLRLKWVWKHVQWEKRSSRTFNGSVPLTKLHPKNLSTSPKSNSLMADSWWIGFVAIRHSPPPFGKYLREDLSVGRRKTSWWLINDHTLCESVRNRRTPQTVPSSVELSLWWSQFAAPYRHSCRLLASASLAHYRNKLQVARSEAAMLCSLKK